MQLRSLSSWLCVLAIGVLLATSPVAAITFSFASDDNHDGPTFRGNSGGSMPADLNDAAAFSVDSAVNVDLMIDLNNDGSGSVVIFPATFTFVGHISGYTLSARGGNWVHSWDVDGVASFRLNGSGQNLLAISFENALLTSLSPNIATLGATATLQSSEAVDRSIKFTTYPLLQGVGVNDGAVALQEDFAFTMTNIRRPDNNALPMLDHGFFLRDWISEGSFSAHALAGFAEFDPIEQ